MCVCVCRWLCNVWVWVGGCLIYVCVHDESVGGWMYVYWVDGWVMFVYVCIGG